MSTQVGIGKSIHRNPKIAASEAVGMALKTGGIEKADFVFMFSSVGYDQKTIVKYVYDFCGGARCAVVPLKGRSPAGKQMNRIFLLSSWPFVRMNFGSQMAS